MTVSSTSVRKTYSGNGSTTAFSYPYYFLAKADLVVTRTDNTTGVITTLLLNTDYTIAATAAANGTFPSGGTVNTTVAPASGTTLNIVNTAPFTQGTHWVDGDPDPALVKETAFDKLTLLAQYLFDALSRVVSTPSGGAGTFNPTLPSVLTPNYALTVNALGTGWTLTPVPGVLTANKALASDSSGAVVVTATTDTELGYLSGVTSSVQTQLNGKQATGSYLTALTGHVVASGPGSSAAVIQAGVVVDSMIGASAAITLTKLAAVTASRALVSTGSGFVSASSVTATELGYVSGVTSAIQTQLGTKYQSGDSPTFANLTITGYVAVNRRDESSAATINQLNSAVGFVKLTATVTQINGILAGTNGQEIEIYNNTGSPVTIANQSVSASAADRIISTDGNDITLADKSPTRFRYDAAQSRWVVSGGSGGGGGGGTGNVTGQASSADGEITLFSGTGGKTIKRATGTGFVKATSGVYGTVANIDLTADVSTTILPVANGGTGLASITAHKLMVGNGTTAATLLAVGTTGQVLRGQSAADPVWGALVLTTDVTGILPVANGGTGVASPTIHAVYVGNGSSAMTGLTVGATGQVLRGQTGADPVFGALVLTTDVTGILPVANGGTNASLSLSNGGIVYSTASALAVLAAGSSGQTVQSAGAGAPTFVWGAIPQIFGSTGSPRLITAGTGITSGASHMSTTANDQLIFASGNSAGDNVAATISAGTIVGQTIKIIGESATNILTLDDATTTNLVGKKSLGLNDVAYLTWDGTNWILG